MIKRTLLTATVSAFLLFPLHCREKAKLPFAGAAAKKTALVPSPFIPPADSVVSSSRMAAWLASNRPLDSLSILFSDSLMANDASARDRSTLAFPSAQDRICAENGLPGGYDEYRWIIDNIGHVKNRARFDSLLKAKGLR